MKDTKMDQLQQIIKETPWLMDALEVLSSCGEEEALIGAGAIRNLVWNRLHGAGESAIPDDLDVVFFDAEVEVGELEEELLGKLRLHEPELPWEVTNQAHVHHWYAEDLALCLAEVGEFEEARPYFLRALTIRKMRRDTDLIRSTEDALSELASRLQNPRPHTNSV